ncbi:hypothetical protein ACFCZ6_16045 [Streptomyces hydrogenans]|uniref:hypothetical protein n=1 Tax=Streptomyces hydrogenans TaxID=1873719 RepID=UPI0035E2AC0B
MQKPTSTGHSTYASTISYTITVPKPVFFEPGKMYTRFVGWSIRAQTVDVTERFECTVVERDGDGRRVGSAGSPPTRARVSGSPGTGS